MFLAALIFRAKRPHYSCKSLFTNYVLNNCLEITNKPLHESIGPIALAHLSSLYLSTSSRAASGSGTDTGRTSMDLNLWKNKDELKKFLENLGVEYRYGCFEENNPESCHLLGDYLLSIDKARTKAAQVYKTNCDDNKYGLSCDAYGRMAFRGQGMEGPDIPLALEYFIKGCDQNEPRSCYHAGQFLGVVDKNVNKVIPPDPDRALVMLKKACFSTKQPQACTLVHSFYLRGVHGKPADMDMAAKFAQIACDQDEHMACYNLSRMFHLGDGVPADQEKSAYYRERAKDIAKGVKKNLEPSKDAKPDL